MTLDKDLLPQFDSIKHKDEEILWIGRPRFIPYLAAVIGFGLPVMLFSLFWILNTYNAGTNDPNSGVQFLWLVGLFPLIVWLVVFYSRVVAFSNTFYALTNRRILIRSGFIGTYFIAIDHDKILETEVTVNFLERAYDAGSIRFFSGRTYNDTDGINTKHYDRWCAIARPGDILSMVKQTTEQRG